MTSRPSRKIRPLVGSISRLIIFSVVDLPQPGRADQADHLAGQHLEVELVDRDRPVGVLLADSLEPDHRFAAAPRSPEGAVAFMPVTLLAADGISIEPSCYSRLTNHWICADYLHDRYHDLRRALVQHLQITGVRARPRRRDRLPARAAWRAGCHGCRA